MYRNCMNRYLIIAIDEPIRKKFFGEIEHVINEHGGILKLYDTMDLQLARKT